ncbi:MAG: radical SAM protein [Nanoarchaeota archaeon]|nr:radical SAM protein [Nanoarchaeota archaeon]
MECKIEKPHLEVKVDNVIYEIEFGQIQIEITGKCNMKCEHCRAFNQPKEDMPLEQITKIIKFARQFSPNYKEIIISGGEPLLHNKFFEILKVVRKNGGEFITLTTNGSLLTKKHLDLIKELDFKRFQLSISLDSLNSEDHNKFRKYPKAFEKAVESLKLVSKSAIPNLISSIRATIKASQIGEMKSMVQFAEEIGCKRISFSAIHPAGKAIERKDLWMTMNEKKRFIEEIYRLKKNF